MREQGEFVMTLRRWRSLLSGRLLLVPAFCIGLVALMWVGLFQQISFERDRAIERRYEEQDRFARLFEEHVLGVLTTAGVTLREVESAYRRRGAGLNLTRYLRERSDLLPYFRFVTVIDRDGYMVLNSGPFTKPLSVRETESFQYHLNNTTLELYVAKPRFGKASGKWTILVTRRMNRPDGSFGGNTTIGIDPAYFSSFYDEISLGSSSVVALTGRDGIVRARRSNENAEVGQVVGGTPLFTTHLPAGAVGHATWASGIDGVSRLYSYRAVRGFPLVVVVGNSEQDTLAGVMERWRAYEWSAIGTSILILGFAALVTWQGVRRRRYERALGEREARYRAIVETSADGFWVLDSNTGRILEVNDRYLHRSGYTREELCALTVFDIDAENSRAKLEALISKGDTQAVAIFETLHRARDGSIWPVEVSTVHMPIEGGRRYSFLRDITERKRAESERVQLAAIVENSEDAIISLGAGNRVLTWNAAAERLFGYAAHEAIGKEIDFIIPEDRRPEVARSRALRAEGRAEPPYDTVRLARDGRLIDVSVARSSIRDAGGRTIGVSLTIRDIGARREAEQALRESETRYRALAETAADAIITANSDGRVTTWNRAAERMFCHAPEQIIGQPLAMIMPERYRDAHSRGLRRAAARDARAVTAQTLELHGLTRDGREMPVELSLSRWSTAKGTFFTAVIRDITERKRLEETHLQAQKLESLGTLAGGIAHDFNNILAAIRGNVDLAAEDVGPDHAAAESLEEIKKAAARASELVRRIMAFGRPKEARQQVVDLGAVVREVLKLLRSTLPAGISLKTNFAKDTPHVLADAGQIHEAIVNLTTNAAHAIGPRAGLIEYRLEPVQVGEKLAQSIPGLEPGRYARLTVSDSGCGMDAATLERIFDAFYTTKPQGEGTGLGLSMVHGTMKSHGGAVTVESTPGAGSTFALYFPAAKEKVIKEEEGAPAQSLPSPGKRVLYVDDEEALVFLADRVLSRLGHSISGFTDPREALAAFRARPQEFDIVVTDLSMPHMSGFELAHEVLALRPGVPVLMTSGYIRAEDEHLARAAGIRELVLKPVTMDELGRMLDRLFRI